MTDGIGRIANALRGAFGLAWIQLRSERGRSLVAVFGIAMAVCSTTLLAGGAIGVTAVGEQQFDAADRDLWVTGGPLGLTATGGGGFTNAIHDAHEVASAIEAREDVRHAVPLAFRTVYVGENGSSFEFDTVVASGVAGNGPSVSLAEGDHFTAPGRHYANGTFDGPMSREVIVDDRTAETYELEPGDTIHVGGTIASARDNEFTVVGVSPTFSQFLGAPTITLPLGELQTVTGTTGTDPATMLAVTLEDDADPSAVQADLEAEYPGYEIRTNREQLEAIVSQRATLLVGAGMLGLLALVTGSLLTTSLLALFVYQHREELSTLGALGVSRRTVAGLVIAQGLLLGVAGWLTGVLLTYPAARAVNAVVSGAVGYDGLIVVSPLVLATSGLVAVGIGAVAAAIASWRVPRSPG